jgi:hypothetical protein
MLDRRAERHLLRLLTQKNSNSDLIPKEPDGMADDDVPILDSWTERTSEDLWVLGDEVGQATPVMEFAPCTREISQVMIFTRMDIMAGKMDHVEHQPGLDGHFVDETIRERTMNLSGINDVSENLRRHLMARCGRLRT